MFFRSWRAGPIPRSTSRWPTRRGPQRRRRRTSSRAVRPVAGGAPLTLVDGGVFAINPAMCALAEVARSGRLDEILVASLGTGSKTDADPVRGGRGWGRLEWARADPRRRVRRRRRHRRLPGSAAAARRQLPPLPDRASPATSRSTTPRPATIAELRRSASGWCASAPTTSTRSSRRSPRPETHGARRMAGAANAMVARRSRENPVRRSPAPPSP